MPIHASNTLTPVAGDLRLAEQPNRVRDAKVKDRLEADSSASASRAALAKVFSIACPRHLARADELCWLIPGDPDHPAACGNRTRRAGFVATPSERATSTRPPAKSRWH